MVLFEGFLLMGLQVQALAVSYLVVSSYVSAYGLPWRPVPVNIAGPTCRRRERRQALVVTLLAVVAIHLGFFTLWLAFRQL